MGSNRLSRQNLDRRPDRHLYAASVHTNDPNPDGVGLVNLVAELEGRLTGSGRSPGLEPSRAKQIPNGATYVLCLFDGLGAGQVRPDVAPTIAGSLRSILLAPFPTTTTVSLATVASAVPAGGHGVIGHLMWLPQLGQVVNTLKWIDRNGDRVAFDTAQLLPSPNLWERLTRAGCEPITVQPDQFEGTPLSRALYRGCRFEPATSVPDWITAVVELATVPGRLIFAYLPDVDFAAHLWGQRSTEYRRAVSLVDNAWSSLLHLLPDNAVLVGTADHGHIDYGSDRKVLMRDEFDSLVAYGDPRSVFLKGERGLIERFAQVSGGVLIEREHVTEWLGGANDHHPDLDARLPDAVVLAPPGKILLPRGFDRRLVGYHGGRDPRELEIPLLVRA